MLWGCMVMCWCMVMWWYTVYGGVVVWWCTVFYLLINQVPGFDIYTVTVGRAMYVLI